MNILCLGCSFTDDMVVNGDINRNSWPKELSKLMPDHLIINAAMGATSVAHSIWVMELFGHSGMQVDKIIFQVTNPGRLTYYKNLERNLNIMDYLKKESDNYMTFNLPKENVLPVNLGLLNNGTDNDMKLNKKLVDFAEQYYEIVDYYHFYLERRTQIEFIEKRADIVFLHVADEYATTMSIQNVLGDQQFDKYVIDNGKHFGIEGIKWQASFIEQLIKDSL